MATSPLAQLPQLRPEYRDASGRVAKNPLALTGLHPHVDVAGLARLFTGPALIGEFLPSSFWTGIELVWSPPIPQLSGASLADVFANAVAELCESAETVGISLSGGLDSAAVLWHVLKLRPKRRIVVFVVDLTDDAGVLTSTMARRILCDLNANAELIVVDPSQVQDWPTWSDIGPRLDALPRLNNVVASKALADGIDVLLSGNGADELLAVPSFATPEVARRWGLRGLRQYLTDVSSTPAGRIGEILTVACRLLPPKVRARAYWAANWPQLCTPMVSDVVPEPLRQEVRAWTDEWIRNSITEHSAKLRSWAYADAMDTFWPRAFVPPAGPIPEASPFLHPNVVSAALGIPIADRYDPFRDDAYHRCKSLVVHLFPESIRELLPTRKQYYTAALAELMTGNIEVPLAHAAGIVDSHVLADDKDIATRMTAVAVEAWLTGAREVNAIIPGLTLPD